MRNNVTEKTKSAPKSGASPRALRAAQAIHRNSLVVLVVAAGVLALAVLVVHAHAAYTNLRVGGRDYRLQIASTQAEQTKGLGDRASMPTSQGMLFAFSGSAGRCFWMKDMHFPLDIIWVKSSHQIGAIVPDISPSTYPHSFCPDVSAQYVIELNAGQAADANLYVGQKLQF